MIRHRLSVALLLVLPLFAASLSADQTLAGRYRAGKIAVRMDRDWTANLPPDLVFESRGSLAVAPDGSVFISNTTRHTIYKFDAAGKFVKAFGRQGQGPGDLTYPGSLSILDDRYLVVGEYATNQRFSLFDLDGKFVKIVATGRFTSRVTALRDGKVAYVFTSGRMEQNEMINVEEVFVIDWKTGAQKSIVRQDIRIPVKRLPNGNLTISQPAALLLAPVRGGGLAVTRKGGSTLDLFAPDGRKLRSIETGWKGVPVTPEYRAKYAAQVRRQAEIEGRKPPTTDPILPEVLGIIQDLWSDSQGNILVARNTGCLEGCSLAFRAYDPGGEIMGDFVIEPGPVVLAADYRFRRMALTPSGLFGLLELKDDPDGFLHLFKTAFN